MDEIIPRYAQITANLFCAELSAAIQIARTAKSEEFWGAAH